MVKMLKLMHFLEGVHANSRPTQGSISYIIDGSALLQAQVILPNKFGGLAGSLFTQLTKIQHVDYVTYSYHPC